MNTKTLLPELLHKMDAYWRATNYLSVAQIYLPDFPEYAVEVPSPGSVRAADARELGVFLRDIARLNREQRNFRIFGPDETLSNRLTAVFE